MNLESGSLPVRYNAKKGFYVQVRKRESRLSNPLLATTIIGEALVLMSALCVWYAYAWHCVAGYL
jgi:hypothetical protein